MIYLLARFTSNGSLVSEAYTTEYPNLIAPSALATAIIPAKNEATARIYLDYITSRLSGKRFTDEQIRVY